MQKQKKPKRPTLLAGGGADDLYLRPGASGVSLALPPPRLPAPALVSGHDAFEVAPLRPRKAKAADTAGAAWAHMAAPELTPALKRELQIVRMRGALDPKRFYKSSDMKRELPKYFAVGTVVEGAEEGAAGRLTKRQRKQSMLDELMADDRVKSRAKNKFQEVQKERSRGVKRQSKRRPRGQKKGRG